MQKIRHFIKSIKKQYCEVNRNLSRRLSLCIAFPLFLLYSLELISGYYHQFTVFSIIFICAELCSIVLFIQFPYTGSIIIIILWITAVSIKPVLPYSFVFAGLSATVILGYINIPSAISILLFATSILFFQPHTDKSALVMFDTTFLTLAIIGCAIRLHQNQKRAINQLTIHKWKEEIAEELHDIVCNDLTYAIHQINLLKNENPNSQRNPEIAENMALLDIRDSLIEALSCSRTAITTLRKDDGSCSTSEIDITTINIIELLEQERMKLAKAGFDGIIAADGSDNLTTTPGKSIIIKQLIKEIFGNILKHADPSHGYVITAYVNASTLHISASDTPLLKNSTSKHPQDNATNNQFGNGTGIHSYQTRLAALGGELSISASDDQWTLEAAIPLMDTDHTDGHHSAGRMRIRLD